MHKLKFNQKVSDTLDISIYGEVSEHEDDGWFGTKPGENSAKKIKETLDANPTVSQINVYINSVGGDVMEGTAIYNVLKRHNAKVTVYVDGFACSIASVIAMAGNKVVMPKNAIMMIHNCWTFAIGNSQDLRKLADDLDVIMEANRQAYLQKAGDKLSEGKLMELLSNESYLTAEKCIELGLADEYSEEDADLELMQSMVQKVNSSIERQVELKQLAKETMIVDEKNEPKPQEQGLLFLFSKLGGN